MIENSVVGKIKRWKEIGLPKIGGGKESARNEKRIKIILLKEV